MSKVLLFTVLLLSTTWVVAQDSSPAGSQSSQPGSSSSQSDQSNSTQASSGMSSGNETSIEGCLNGSGGSYTLTSSTGTYQLTGSTDDLSKHVNQQVRVKGTPIAVSASANTSPSGASSSSAPSSSTSASSPSSSSASQQSFTVSKVTKISDSCSTSNK
jgi:hypothetical protein